MEHESFITYQQAIALYNLDFDWDCEMAYFDRAWNHEHKLVHNSIAYKEVRNFDGTTVYPAPTMAMTARWLR